MARYVRLSASHSISGSRTFRRVTGSNLNELRALEQPRFEDFDYTFVEENASRNKFYWLGNGMTVAEMERKKGTRAWYVPRTFPAKL